MRGEKEPGAAVAFVIELNNMPATKWPPGSLVPISLSVLSSFSSFNILAQSDPVYCTRYRDC